ncbi:hypothetical protein GCM10010103_27970 [Streptomyces paradoxus]
MSSPAETLQSDSATLSRWISAPAISLRGGARPDAAVTAPAAGGHGRRGREEGDGRLDDSDRPGGAWGPHFAHPPLCERADTACHTPWAFLPMEIT